MKYCESCNQNVEPSKKFSIAWFLINCLWIIGGGVYLIYFIFFKKKTCPICNGNNFEHKHNNGEADNIAPEVSVSDSIVTKIENFNAKIKDSTLKRQKYNDECTAKRAEKRQAKLNKAN